MACNQPTTIYVSTIYTIWFNNQAEYNFAVGVSGGTEVFKSPTAASVLFNAPIGPLGDPPYTASPGRGVYIPPSSSGGALYIQDTVTFTLPIDSDSIDIPCANHNAPTWSWPPVHYYWVGVLAYVSPTPAITPDTDQAPVPLRRWVNGFEYEFGAEGAGNSGLQITRDASRTINGLGAAIRSGTNKNFLRPVNVYRTGFTTHDSWERFYVRVRTFGSIPLDIWKTESTPSPTNGIRLYINASGTVSCYNVNAFSVETLLGTSSVIFTQNTYVKIDCLVQYNPNAVGGSGRFRMYAGGTLIFDFVVVAASSGIGATSSFHLQTRLGTQITGANTWEIDLDDWMNADIPNISGVEHLNSLDWILGTHVKATRVTSATLGSWTGQAEQMNQMMSPINVSTGARITSSTSGATMDGITDIDLTSDASGFVICNVTALVSKYGSRASIDGSLGYALAGGSNVMTTIAESSSPQHNTVMYIGTGTDIIPADITPFHVVHTKGASAGLATVYALSAVIEQIGLWGSEDDSTITVPQSSKFLIHNGAFYWNSPWGFPNDNPVAVACSHGGTYIGNGTTQTISIDNPFHLLFVRPLTGGTNNGFKWFASGLTGHLDGKDGSTPECPVHVFYDEATGLASFTVTGTNADVNANGVTYQYIAFSDPAMRYNICGAFEHATTTASAINNLVDSLFTPVAVFTQFEVTPSQSNVVNLSYKGPGHTANQGTKLDGTNIATFLTLGTGAITSLASAHGTNQTTFSAWRTVDGYGSPFPMIQITSYTGDGNASRVITLTPTSGKFPLYAYIQPHNALGIFRDPSHTGTNSGRMTDSTNNITNGITAGGIDSLTVGILLNANGIVYDVFVIVGDTLGWNNGEFCSGPGNPIPPTEPPLPDIAILPEGGIILGGSTPLSLLRDVSGIYTLVPGKTSDTLYDRQTGQTSVEMPIPDPFAKGGYIGG